MDADLVAIPSGWTWQQVGRLCERVSVGYVSSTRAFFCMPGEGVPIVRSQNIRPGRLVLDDVAWVTRAFHDANPKSQLRSGDVLITRVGANAGDVCIVPDGMGDLHLSSAVFARPLNQHRKYIELFFRSPLGQYLLKTRIVGSVSERINTRDVESLSVLVPPPNEEAAIAHILGTLDDKIELNRRVNETLEAMAQALFKSWFVDFDPVRAKAEGRDLRLPKHVGDLFPSRLVDSEAGQLPEGWKVGRVGDYIVNFDSKRVPVSGAERAKRQGQYPYHGAAGVMDYVDDYLFDGIYLLVGEDGSVMQDSGMAVTQYVWGKLWVNNHAHVLQGKGEVTTEQLSLYFHFESVAPYVTGAVQPKLSQGRMNTMPFVFAGAGVCRAFGHIVQPWFAKLRSNVDETQTLGAIRDTLLPRLISGELRVRDAENAVAAAV